MCEKKYVKKTKRFRDSRRLTESEAFIYPVGIKSARSVNQSHFFSLATIVTAVDDRKTKCNKIRNRMIRRIKMERDRFRLIVFAYVVKVISDAIT